MKSHGSRTPGESGEEALASISDRGLRAAGELHDSRGGRHTPFLVHEDFEMPDERQHAWHEYFAKVDSILAEVKSPAEGDAMLQAKGSASPRAYAEVSLGLVYGILTDNSRDSAFLMHLVTFTRDGYAVCTKELQRLINDQFGKIHAAVRDQVVWLTREFIALEASDAEGMCYALLRQVRCGDWSADNFWFLVRLVEVLSPHQNGWLRSKALLLPFALYTTLRALPEAKEAARLPGVAAAAAALLSKGVPFCQALLSECTAECQAVGRDLVRVLREAARRVPELKPAWATLLQRGDMDQQLHARSNHRFLQGRLTPEMETQIKFILTQVRLGCQTRYQKWFHTKHMASVGSETLIPDLVRYVCCCFHPTNQILQSDVTPRWVLIGWLLMCTKPGASENNAKLALFFDWFFFNPKTDSLMNAEPGLLLMINSIPKYASMTQKLLEFVFHTMDTWDPSRREVLARGVTATMDVLVGKGVVRSLETLVTCAQLPPELRARVRATWPAHCPARVPHPTQHPTHPQAPAGSVMEGNPAAASAQPDSGGHAGDRRRERAPAVDEAQPAAKRPKQTAPAPAHAAPTDARATGPKPPPHVSAPSLVPASTSAPAPAPAAQPPRVAIADNVAGNTDSIQDIADAAVEEAGATAEEDSAQAGDSGDTEDDEVGTAPPSSEDSNGSGGDGAWGAGDDAVSRLRELAASREGTPPGQAEEEAGTASDTDEPAGAGGSGRTRRAPLTNRSASSAAGAGVRCEADAPLLGAAAALRQHSQVKPSKRPPKSKPESETKQAEAGQAHGAPRQISGSKRITAAQWLRTEVHDGSGAGKVHRKHQQRREQIDKRLRRALEHSHSGNIELNTLLLELIDAMRPGHRGDITRVARLLGESLEHWGEGKCMDWGVFGPPSQTMVGSTFIPRETPLFLPGEEPRWLQHVTTAPSSLVSGSLTVSLINALLANKKADADLFLAHLQVLAPGSAVGAHLLVCASISGATHPKDKHQPSKENLLALYRRMLDQRACLDGESHADDSIHNARRRAFVVEDLRTCCTWDLVLCEHIIPEVIYHIPEVACGNAEMLYLYFSILDNLSDEMATRLANGKLAAFFPLAQELDSGATADAGKFASEALMLCLHLDEHGQNIALRIAFEELLHQPHNTLETFLRCLLCSLSSVHKTKTKQVIVLLAKLCSLKLPEGLLENALQSVQSAEMRSSLCNEMIAVQGISVSLRTNLQKHIF